MNYSSQATFGLRKHAIQQGQKNFSVLNSFETYGGFTPSTSQISIQSFVVLRCLAAEEMLPETFENTAKGGPQGNFSIGSKFIILLKPSHLIANFLHISYLKTV